MGTTVVGLAIAGNGRGYEAVVFNVGDSRGDALAGERLRRLTHDHSPSKD